MIIATIPVLGWHLLKHCMVGDVSPPVGWFEAGESSILGPKIIHEVMEKVRMIRDRLHTAYSRQKSNADNRKRALECEVGDQI